MDAVDSFLPRHPPGDFVAEAASAIELLDAILRGGEMSGSEKMATKVMDPQQRLFLEQAWAALRAN